MELLLAIILNLIALSGINTLVSFLFTNTSINLLLLFSYYSPKIVMGINENIYSL